MRVTIPPLFPALLSLLLFLVGAVWWGGDLLSPNDLPNGSWSGGGALVAAVWWFPCLFFSWLFGLSASVLGRRYRLAVLISAIYGLTALESWELLTRSRLDPPLQGAVALLVLVPLVITVILAILTIALTYRTS